MKMSIGNSLVLLAIAQLMPVTAIAADLLGDSIVSVVDVRLTTTGTFQGAIVDDKGQALANQPVQILYGSKLVAEAKTDEKGRYTIQGVRSGTHLVKTAKSQQVCRLWESKNAPPAARTGLVMVNNAQVVRGQDEIVIGGLEEIVIGTPEILMMGAFSAVSFTTVHSVTEGATPGSAVAGGAIGGPASP